MVTVPECLHDERKLQETFLNILVDCCCVITHTASGTHSMRITTLLLCWSSWYRSFIPNIRNDPQPSSLCHDRVWLENHYSISFFPSFDRRCLGARCMFIVSAISQQEMLSSHSISTSPLVLLYVFPPHMRSHRRAFTTLPLIVVKTWKSARPFQIISLAPNNLQTMYHHSA